MMKQWLGTTWESKWTFDEPLPIQEQLVPAALEGKDVIAQSPTGTGKTLAYVIPLLRFAEERPNETSGLILAPSQELAIQITDVVREWVQGTDVTVTPLIGGANIKRQMERLKKKPSIVVGTPGRVQELIDMKKLKMHTVLHIVLDEGDQLLESRERKDVASIIRATDDRRQLILVSATVTEAIERVANEWMTDPVRFHVTAEDLPKSGEIVHSFIKAEQRDKLPILRGLANVEGLHALAFMNNVDQVVIKQLQLSDKNVPIGILHGELSKQEREKTLREFRQGKLRILLSTDVAARGLDIDGLTHVIHVDVPREEEQYIHRSGRTGRAGKDGEVLSLLSIREEKDYRRLTKGKKPVHKEWAYGELREKRVARPNSPKSRRRPTKRKKKK